MLASNNPVDVHDGDGNRPIFEAALRQLPGASAALAWINSFCGVITIGCNRPPRSLIDCASARRSPFFAVPLADGDLAGRPSSTRFSTASLEEVDLACERRRRAAGAAFSLAAFRTVVEGLRLCGFCFNPSFPPPDLARLHG